MLFTPICMLGRLLRDADRPCGSLFAMALFTVTSWASAKKVWMSLASPLMNLNSSTFSLLLVARAVSSLTVVTYSAMVLVCAPCARRLCAAQRGLAARTRLAHLAQTNTVAEYLTTLKELTSLATSNCDEECKFGFMSGLAKDIQTCVALAQPATVGEVIANALSEDCTSLGEAYQREQQQPPLTAGRLSMNG